MLDARGACLEAGSSRKSIALRNAAVESETPVGSAPKDAGVTVLDCGGDDDTGEFVEEEEEEEEEEW